MNSDMLNKVWKWFQEQDHHIRMAVLQFYTKAIWNHEFISEDEQDRYIVFVIELNRLVKDKYGSLYD